MSAAPILVRIDVAFNQHLVCGDKSTELPVGVLICFEEKCKQRVQFSFEVLRGIEVTAPKNKRLSCCADMKQGILRLGGVTVRTAVCVHVTAPGGTLGVGGQGICSQPHCQLAKATS